MHLMEQNDKNFAIECQLKINVGEFTDQSHNKLPKKVQCDWLIKHQKT